MFRIGIAGTDARTFLWAQAISREGFLQGVVIRGNRAMEEFNSLMNWPVKFIPTSDNSAKALAQASIEAFKDGRLDYLLAQSEDHYYQGFVDEVIAAGFGDRVAGLTQHASQIEGDKTFGKKLCQRANVPVSDYWDLVDARNFAAIRTICCRFFNNSNGAVLKFPFSAGGKGSRIITDIIQIREVYEQLMKDYTENYKKICGKDNPWPLLIESLMGGMEISFTVFVDDSGHFQILPTSMDYARRFAGPAGPGNPVTGGMGAISPHPLETSQLIEMAKETIVAPFIKQMEREGLLRRCILYFGCFVTVNGTGLPIIIRVSEVNIRMGEPEVQAVVRRLKNPGELLLAMFENRLNEVVPEVREDQVCITIALVTGPGGPDGQKGYPWSYTKGESLLVDHKYLMKNNLLFIPSGADFDEKKGGFISDGTRVGYIMGNAKRGNVKNLRERLLNAYRNGKIKVVPRENPEGNRLAIREDCGSEFCTVSELFGMM